VIQHVLERGAPEERARAVRQLAPQVVQLSQHKFASNVVEKCLASAEAPERALMVRPATAAAAVGVCPA
jgi:pumilio RNA-binding family